jgi:hypothetical protein
MLNRRVLQSTDTMHRAIEAAGGLHVAPAVADPMEVRREVLARGIRALEVQGRDIEVVRDLPLDFLVTFDVDAVEPITTLQGLRGLHIDSWTGHLDFDDLQRLEWFTTTEIAPNQLDPLLERDRPTLHHLWVGRYRFADVTPLTTLKHLTRLAIGDSRSFTSLQGLAALPALQHFHAYLCPKLASLDGVEAAVGLRHVCLETCNRITDLAPLAHLEGLRSVQIEMRVPPALTPLVGHPALEYLWIVSAKRPEPDVVDALLRAPRLRFLAAGRSAWLRCDGSWERVPDIYAMTERQRAMHEQVTDERVGVAAW